MGTIRFVTEIGEDNVIRPPDDTELPSGKAEVTVVQKGDEEESTPSPAVRGFGSARGLITISDDFDEPLEDFRDYM